MHRTVRPVLIVAVATAALLGAGCSTTVSGTAAPAGTEGTSGAPVPPTTGAAETDAVAWVDEVCGALLSLGDTVGTQPTIDGTDPEAAVRSVSEYLGDAVTSLDSAVAQMEAAGPSPVDGGDEIVDGLGAALTSARATFAESKTKLDAVDPTNLQELATVLPEALAPLQELQNLPDPTADLQSSPELDAAAEQAPNCQALSGG